METKARRNRRVKCANCGMIYDIPNYQLQRGDPTKMVRGTCPKCGSNANDPITSENHLEYTQLGD